VAAALVTLTTAKLHLRITTAALDPGDADIQLKLDQAEAVILDYLDTSADPAWTTPATAPGWVTASILLLLTDLYENRGDATSEVSEKTWEAVTRLLVRARNPALA
jgi:hypothetical protein